MYDVLIIVNGEIPSITLWQHFPHHLLICTDGAALFLKNTTLIPDYIVGDMDSIADAPPIATVESLQKQFPHSKIHLNNDQETTDFEKTLQFVQELEKNEVIKLSPKILVIGFFGKSADHSIYNLCLLNRYSKLFDLTLLHHYQDISQWVIALPIKVNLHLPKNTIISFFPWSQATLTTSGLGWELINQTISLEDTNAVRNKTINEHITIECEGNCLCFITSEKPPIAFSRELS